MNFRFQSLDFRVLKKFHVEQFIWFQVFLFQVSGLIKNKVSGFKFQQLES